AVCNARTRSLSNAASARAVERRGHAFPSERSAAAERSLDLCASTLIPPICGRAPPWDSADLRLLLRLTNSALRGAVARGAGVGFAHIGALLGRAVAAGARVMVNVGFGVDPDHFV